MDIHHVAGIEVPALRPATAMVLIVEDEPKLAAILSDYFESSGYRTRWIADGSDVLEAVKADPPDMIILDLNLPRQDGISICRKLRSFSGIPLMMVTARSNEVDRLLGLELGADDYICKPFSPREVVARAKAILRRTAPGSSVAKIFGLSIDEEQYQAALDGVVLELTPVEFRLLRVLSSSPGRVFSRSQLLDHLYADHRVVTDRAVDSHVKNLRRKLQQVRADQEIIESVYGVGYKLDLSDGRISVLRR